MTPEGIEQLKIDEGFRGQPYKCSAGKTTIAFGRNLEANPLTEEEGTYLLINDLEKVQDKLEGRDFFDKLNDVRKDVIINMTFNMGLGGVLRFKNMIAAIENDDYEHAANEMLNSRWARQVGNRADRLAKKMKLGQ